MTIGIAGNYVLRLKFGTQDVPIVPSAFEEFSVIQDINRLLPYFQLQLADTTGSLTHVMPFDKEMTRVSVQFGTVDASDVTNQMSFQTFRRFPEAINQASTHYDLQGLLNVPNLFNPSMCRANNGSVYDFIAAIATNELLADKLDISESLKVNKLLIQPKWSNAEFLRYLSRMLGDEEGYTFLPYFYVKDGLQTFSLKSLEDMCIQDPSYKFIVADTPYEDYLPVTDYAIYDNYQALGIKGVIQQQYGFFDYEYGAWMEGADSFQNYLSLSEYLAWDWQDHIESDPIYDTGRTNDLTYSFIGRVRGEYYKRLNSMVKMWIHTWGLPNIVPGQIVKVLFAQGVQTGSLATYQYSGYWLVERVVQSFGATFTTKLLLTRAGMDTDQFTTLIPAMRRKT